MGQTVYDSAYDTTFPTTYPNWGISRINDSAISFQRVDGTIVSNLVMKPKAIHDEMGGSFDDFGRMAAKLGLSVVPPSAATANFILQNYVDPPTEIVKTGEVQIWKITHNGVDTHPIHFHLFDVQVHQPGRLGRGHSGRPTPTSWAGRTPSGSNPLRGHDRRDAAVDAAGCRSRIPNSFAPLNPAMPIGSESRVLQHRPDRRRRRWYRPDQPVLNFGTSTCGTATSSATKRTT